MISTHRWFVDHIYHWWLRKFPASEAGEENKENLVKRRVRGLIHSSLFTVYMLMASVFLVSSLISCGVTGEFWRFMAPVLSVVVFSPIAYKLWTYRTTDKETEEVDREAQANLAYCSQGIRLVTSDSDLQKAVGIKILIRVSKKTSTYDEEIEYLFMETLREPLVGVGDSYVQSIVKWLYQYCDKEDKNPPRLTSPMEIHNQTFDLTSEDCKKSLTWLLLLEGRGIISINFEGSELKLHFGMSSRINKITKDEEIGNKETGLPRIIESINNISNRGGLSDDNKIVKDYLTALKEELETERDGKGAIHQEISRRSVERIRKIDRNEN